MPLYEYKCENCGDVFEVMQKFSDTPLTQHAQCGGGPVHRLISAPALQFKGSGWYITDYAKKSGDGQNGSAKKEEGGSKPASSSEGGESKPATTTSTSSSSDTKSTS